MTLENLPPLAFEDDNTFFDFPAFRDFCLNLSSRGAILADRNVLEKALALQEALGPVFPLIPLSGEKTRAAKEAVEDELLKRGLGRRSSAPPAEMAFGRTAKGRQGI